MRDDVAGCPVDGLFAIVVSVGSSLTSIATLCVLGDMKCGRRREARAETAGQCMTKVAGYVASAGTGTTCCDPCEHAVIESVAKATAKNLRVIAATPSCS
jgi:3-oxoacyl-(acyl-carrier-protein) synthase